MCPIYINFKFTKFLISPEKQTKLHLAGNKKKENGKQICILWLQLPESVPLKVHLLLYNHLWVHCPCTNERHLEWFFMQFQTDLSAKKLKNFRNYNVNFNLLTWS